MWYTVQPGESLSILAGRYLGNIMLYDLIFQQNRNILSSPDVVKTGQVLWIPVDGKSRPSSQSSTSSNQPPASVTSTSSSSGPTQTSNYFHTEGFLKGFPTNKTLYIMGAGLIGIASIIIFTGPRK